jgi:glutamyl-tRNA synthetase
MKPSDRSDRSDRSERSDRSDRSDKSDRRTYRGRLAPTPSGWLHLGHAATFRTAWERARRHGGILVYREEDIDRDRCRPQFAAGALEDLRWWGLDWDEGPDCGGPFGPYRQSERLHQYADCLRRLSGQGCVYPSPESRKAIASAGARASPVDGDAVFPAGLRREARRFDPSGAAAATNWRFRVPDGRVLRFHDGRAGEQAFVAGRDFGDFLVWRRDGMPAYELAVVADDHAMAITEVVRGADLLLSTARQLLLYEALGWTPPAWHHCPLVDDPATGRRMSKTHRSLGLRALRQRGLAPGLEPAAYL